MAAHLKKRALAEYSQVILEQPEPVKRLRLVIRQSIEDVNLNFQEATTSHQVLSSLLSLEERFPLDAENASTVSKQLLDHYEREKESLVRIKIASLLAQIARIPEFNAGTLADEIIDLTKAETSHKVLAQLINTALQVGQSLPLHANLHNRIIEIAKQHMTDSHHLVRSRCVEVIGALGTPDHKPESERKTKENNLSLQRILCSCINDFDPRVRSSAMQALLHFHQRGLELEQDVYNQACKMMTDDYEAVRLRAVKLVWVLSHLYPDNLVKLSDSDEDVRLVDDGFAKICNMVTDMSMIVRIEAVGLLGSLHQVSPGFLEQTLDKKLMSNMRRKTSAHERAKEHYMSGEWSTGQKWADDKPKEEVDIDSVKLISVGACGAFVHGLEDEFYEVRNAALDSLCELASQSAAFAMLSQDSIIDMFNDEIESVRLNAVNSLRKISQHVELREDQLEIILGVLQDFSHTTREALRNMLGDMKLATKDCLNQTILALLDNMRRYPQDRSSIWKCMKNIGQHHPELTLTLTPDLLCLHPYFDTPEPDMDDPSYISVLTLVFNAAVKCPTMLPMFMEHTWRHYTYLRNTMPDITPPLQTPYKVTMTGSDASVKHESGNFLHQAILKLDKIDTLDTETVQQLLDVIVRDLRRISKVDNKLSASSECVCLFLESQHLLTKLQSECQSFMNTSITSDHLLATVKKVLTNCSELMTKFLGLSNAELAMVHQTQLKALTFYLSSCLMRSQTSVDKKVMKSFVTFLKDIQRFILSSECGPDKFTFYLLSEISSLETCEAEVFNRIIQYSINFMKPCSFPIKNKIRRRTITMHEPSGAIDNPVKFSAGLTTAVTVDATIENITNIANLAVQIKYPDGQTQIIPCKMNDFQKMNPLRHRLVTHVLLSHAQWTDSCQVELCLVYIPTEEETNSSSAVLLNLSDFGVSCGVQQMCSPIPVLIHPRPAKR